MHFFKKNSLGSDALMLTASNFAVSLIGMVTSMLLARFRTLNEYGTYSQIIMVTDLVSTILLLGLPGSVNYFMAKAEDQEEKRRFLTLYVVLSTVITGVIGLCLFLAVPLIIEYFDNPYIATFAYIFGVYPWASIMLNSLGNVCIVCGKAKRLVVFNLIHTVTTLVLLLAAKFFDIGFQAYTLLYMGSMLGFAIFAVTWMRRMVGGFRFCVDLKLIKAIFAFSIPMGLASSVGTLNSELDKLIIGKFFTTEQYAVFANAAKALPVTMLASSLNAVLLPKMVRLLAQQRKEEALSLWGSAINISFCVMCLIVGGFVVFAPDVMSLFYSEKYVTAEGVAVFRIYSLILLFRATYWGIVLNATGKTKLIFFSSVMTLLLNCVGNIVFYYWLGFVGPAVASLLTVAFMNLFQLYWTCRSLNMTFKRIFPWRDILHLLAQTAAMGCMFYGIKYGLMDNFRRSLSIVISICLGVIWAALHFGINAKRIKENWKMLNSQKLGD